MTPPNGTPASPVLENAPVMLVTRADAEQVCERIVETMKKLQALILEETRLFKTGKIAAASELALAKSELARQYSSDMRFAKDNQALLSKLVPVQVDAIRRLHETFRGELQVNLAVIATAKAVSEDLVRGVSNVISKAERPQTYGAQGRMAGTNGAPRHGITVNRSL